jgi:hypothetical protein
MGQGFPRSRHDARRCRSPLHHASIFEINVDSYRRRAALERKQKGPGRPQNRATIKDLDPVSLHDNQTHT